MYCFSKYLFAYTIITTLGHELVGKSDTTECKNLKEIYLKDPKKIKDCLKKENIRSNFINTIFQKYFSMYLNIEGVGGAASGTVAFGGEAVAGGGETSFGGALAGFGKVLGFGGV